jgi:hypothetical protein
MVDFFVNNKSEVDTGDISIAAENISKLNRIGVKEEASDNPQTLYWLFSKNRRRINR